MSDDPKMNAAIKAAYQAYKKFMMTEPGLADLTTEEILMKVLSSAINAALAELEHPSAPTPAFPAWSAAVAELVRRMNIELRKSLFWNGGIDGRAAASQLEALERTIFPDPAREG